jgi:chromosome segregation ATPase
VDGLTRKALENETVTINLADAQAFFKHFDSQQTTMTKDLFEMQERVKNAEFVAEQYPKDEWHKQYDKLKSEKEKMEEDLGRMLGGVKQTNDRLDIHIFHLEEELKTYKKDLNEQAAEVEQLKAERYALQIELGHAMVEATNFQILLNQYSGPTPQDVAGERRAWESQREELSNRNSGLEKKLQERKTAYKDKVIEQERKYLLELFDANCASANLVPRYVDKAIQNLDNLKKNVQKETGEVGQNWRAWTIKLRGDLAARIGQFDEAARLYQEATVVLDAIDFPSVDTPNLIAQVQKALQDLSRQRTKTQKGIDEAFN